MKKLIFILLIINLGCSSSNDLQFINRFVDGNTKLLNIINNNDIQLKLTVIDSAENFIEHEYNIDTNQILRVHFQLHKQWLKNRIFIQN